MQASRQTGRTRVGRSMQRKRWGGEVERTGNGAGKRGEEVGNGCGCLTGPRAGCLREGSRVPGQATIYLKIETGLFWHKNRSLWHRIVDFFKVWHKNRSLLALNRSLSASR